MACSDFFSDLSFLRYKFLTWIGAVDCIQTMWLPELTTFAIFWDLKIYSMIETDILWYGLREHVSCCYCGACISFSIAVSPCLPCIMNYQLCMTHDLATANHHDHAWTAKWAQNIFTLSMPMSPMRLRYDNRQHGRRGHLYETKGTWKNYPTCFALLDVGFMIVLRICPNMGM